MTTKEFFNTFASSLRKGLHTGGFVEFCAPVSTTGVPMQSSFQFFRSKFLSGHSVLDFGCGYGTLAVNFPDDIEYTGIDFSEEMLSFAPEKSLNVNFVCQDFHDLPFEDKSFDVVVANESLFYGDVAEAHSEIHRVLKDGGKFYSKMPLYRESSSFDSFNKDLQAVIDRVSGLNKGCFGFQKYNTYAEELSKLFAFEHEIGVEVRDTIASGLLKGCLNEDPSIFPTKDLFGGKDLSKEERVEFLKDFFQKTNFVYPSCIWSSQGLFTCSKK